MYEHDRQTPHKSIDHVASLRSFHYSLYVRCILSWGRALGPLGGLSTGQLNCCLPRMEERERRYSATNSKLCGLVPNSTLNRNVWGVNTIHANASSSSILCRDSIKPRPIIQVILISAVTQHLVCKLADGMRQVRLKVHHVTTTSST